jgi:hypothetical protein
MSNTAVSYKRTKNRDYISSSTLALVALASALFPRLLESGGAPAPINFLHFAVVPAVWGIALLKTKTKERRQISISHQILFGLLLFVAVALASAILSSAGLINVVLSFLLLAEPFMLLLTIICLPLTAESYQKFETWVTRFIFFHLFLIYVQKFVLGFCHLPGDCDNIQGVFYRSGSGHVVGASVSCSFAAYYFATAKDKPLWLRSLILLLGFGNILASDAKQVLLTFIVGFAIQSLTKKNLGKVLLYVFGLIIFVSAFTWAIYNVEAFAAFGTWIRPEIYGPNGEATKVKFAGIRVILEHHSSPLHTWLGLGPGHSIGRLGGWMLRDYGSLLNPLGATSTTVGAETWVIMGASWLAEGTSLFSPFWGWAAIWGDLGFLGLAAYLFLCAIVWCRVCANDICKLLMLTVMAHGFIFTQMEEPGYMLFVAVLIGMNWQKQRVEARTQLLKKLQASTLQEQQN